MHARAHGFPSADGQTTKSASSPPVPPPLALPFCHRRDMSLENVLLTEHGEAKIVDFGMALRFGQPQGRGGAGGASAGGAFSGGAAGSGSGGISNARSISPTGPFGKKHYMPPEVALNEREYDGYMVDMWACGVIMFM